MEVIRPTSFRDADVEIVKRTITEEYPNNNIKDGSNNNIFSKKETVLISRQEETQRLEINGGPHHQAEEEVDDNDESFVVIELVDEDESRDPQISDSYVDIDLKTSKQLLVYLSKKPRCFVKCHTRAVSQVPVAEKHSTGRVIFYLEPWFRLTIARTELWYLMHRSAIYIRPPRRSVRRKPFHYTEKVECDTNVQDSPDAGKSRDLSGYQLIFSDEAKNEVSKLTLSADFTTSYEERHSKLGEISRDIEISGDSHEPGALRRSYSIEFLSEDKDIADSFSSEAVARKIEEGNVKEIYEDSVDDRSSRSEESLLVEAPMLKRSYSIEFLHEEEDSDKPFSSEVVHYKMDKGEGVLVYSEGESFRDEEDVTEDCHQDTGLRRSYSIEFLAEDEDKPSNFSYETVSNKIEKGEGRLIYDDSHNSDDSKLVSRIEMMNEIDDEQVVPIYYEDTENEPKNDEVFEDEVVAEEVRVEQTEQEMNFFDEGYGESENLEDDSQLEKKIYNVEFLEEKPAMFLDVATSTPAKNRLPSPKKSPLQTVHIGLEFQKRNKSENDDEGSFINENDEYLVYEDSSQNGEGRVYQNGGGQNPSFKLKTIVVNMDTHHDRKRPSLTSDRKYQLEFQTEENRRLSMLHEHEARKARIPSDSLRTVSIETGNEEVIGHEHALMPPQLLSKKAYSVEYLNELEGDRSVFYEEMVDDVEPKWKLEL
eukprot:Seg2616.2 transcript_id=Seg2616.2/GoldUCD/mRNA.D3Y31 product="hypothetical protein" protein_id=Seg2616.2/GoldUCD/D3Y31